MFGFPTRSERLLARFRRRLPAIESAIKAASTLPDEGLAQQLGKLKHSVSHGASMDSVLPECFALVYEAARRTLGLSAYPVQLLGAQALAAGHIAEMRTGEGKTLVAAFPATLWALEGKGVHVITANDYLASRDAQTLGPIYRLLGLEVAVAHPRQTREDKALAYAADITYGTSTEFGFDYLRHHMAPSLHAQVRRPSHCALVDEVDSLLIDEARTPLIISGDVEQEPSTYQAFADLARQLTRQEDEHAPGDYWVDEKQRRVHLSEQGLMALESVAHQHGWVPEGQSLYAAEHLSVLHMADMALRAHALFQRDVHYVVNEGQVVLVDPFTGRTQPGRRWDHGLHQAVEVKEGLVPGEETRTFASIAIQHYFSTYQRVGGMTGTAATEKREFKEIYGLDIVEIPTHKPMIRQDFPDVICVSKEDKYRRIVEEVAQMHHEGRPVLVGTPSVAVSDELARRLEAAGLPFKSLNARDHAREAQVIASAGKAGAITLATSMAGRGTDIILGGQPPQPPSEDDETARQAFAQELHAWEEEHKRVVALGGLHVIGVERQESRRVDNQFRGRAGRQGDPGSSRFYLSLEDDLLRIFAQGWAKNLLGMLGVVEGQVIENARISKQVEKAQRQMEAHHFNARKNLLDYDQVIHEQRTHVYADRQAWLEERHDPTLLAEQAFDILTASWRTGEATSAEVEKWLAQHRLSFPPGWEDAQPEQWEAWAWEAFMAVWKHLSMRWGDRWEEHLSRAAVGSLDTAWRAHLERLDILRQGIHLRGYAQKQPLLEYRKDAHESFMLALNEARTLAVGHWLTPPPEEGKE